MGEPSFVRQRLEEELASDGRHVLLADLPIDALRWLQDWDNRVENLIVVDPNCESNELTTFLKFASRAFPETRRGMVVESSYWRDARRALRSGLVDSVLPIDWQSQRLANLLDKPIRLPSEAARFWRG